MDIVNLATYMGRNSPDSADRFMDAANTFAMLASCAQLGAIHPTRNNRLVGLRVFQIKGFPNHLAFYLERAYGVEIVRVLHGARDVEAILRYE